MSASDAARPKPDLTDVTVVLGDDHVAEVEIHRPPNNYFDLALVTEIVAACNWAAADLECRAIVLCAEGKHFCAGADLAGRDPEENRRETTLALYAQAANLMEVSVPIIAAVHGAAIGGGLGVACAADFRITCREARLSANFARLGFHHGFGLTVTLPAIVGSQRATELLYTGRRLNGEEAVAVGLCDRLVAVGDVRSAARALASEIALSAPLSLRKMKATLRADTVARLRVATQHEANMQEILRETEDYAEGVKADAERRPANFVGR